MKIVLRQDVPKLGEAGTIQEVKPGFARNYLIPQGMAVLATAGEIKTAEHNGAVKARKIAKQEAQLQTLADKIEGKRLEFTARAGEGGRLYGSITAGDIADELAKIVGEEIDRRRVVLEDPIRQLGEHAVTVHLVGRLRPAITVAVVGDAEYQLPTLQLRRPERRKPRRNSRRRRTSRARLGARRQKTETVDEGPSHEWVDERGVPGAHGFIDNEGGAATLTEETGKGVEVEEELDPVGES